MRIEGNLTKWNDERGYGFITARTGGQELFVHVSSFPRDGRRPKIGESISFEIETDKEGRKRAVAIERPLHTATRAATPSARPRGEPSRPRRRGLLGRVAPMIILIMIGSAGYGEYMRRTNTNRFAGDLAPPSAATAENVANSAFRCDERTQCSQMTSCAEATFFLRNCPGVSMDGDGDGVPCESQWCGR